MQHPFNLQTYNRFAMFILNHLIHLIYPNLCLACNGNLMAGEEFVCLSCLSKLPYTDFNTGKINPIEQHFWGKFPIEGADALFFYRKATSGQHLLQALKYKGEKQLGEMLGRHLGARLAESPVFCSADVIVPVPLHPKKYRERGFNQSEYICNGIAKILQIPLNLSNLQRLIENPTQTKKGVYERWENTRGIFGMKDVTLFQTNTSFWWMMY